MKSVQAGAKREPQAAGARVVMRRNGSVEVWISLPRNRWTKWARARRTEYFDIAKREGATAIFVEYPSLLTGRLVNRLVYGKVDWKLNENGEMEWL